MFIIPTAPLVVTVTNGATGGVLDDPQLVDTGSSFTLSCVVTGSPTTISWTKGSDMLTTDDTISIVRSGGVSNLTITNFTSTDGGVYTCNVANIAQSVTSSSDVRLSKY